MLDAWVLEAEVESAIPVYLPGTAARQVIKQESLLGQRFPAWGPPELQKVPNSDLLGLEY